MFVRKFEVSKKKVPPKNWLEKQSQCSVVWFSDHQPTFKWPWLGWVGVWPAPFFCPPRSLFTMSSTHFFHPLTELFRFGLFAQQVVPTRKGWITNSKYLKFSEWTSSNFAWKVKMFKSKWHKKLSSDGELKSHAPLLMMLMRLNSGEANFDPAASLLWGVSWFLIVLWW